MPEQSSYRVVVAGAGFGGLGMAAALRQAGIDDFLVLDRGDDLGGTWRDNTYPGLACDVPSNLYSFSFRPSRWSRRFPPRAEILGYLRALAADRGLGRNTNNWPDHTFLYRYRVRRFDLGRYRVMPKRPAAAGTVSVGTATQNFGGPG
jgi:cation diffusion facilitator CzcD-associated flavoprotein CzcO